MCDSIKTTSKEAKNDSDPFEKPEADVKADVNSLRNSASHPLHTLLGKNKKTRSLKNSSDTALITTVKLREVHSSSTLIHTKNTNTYPPTIHHTVQNQIHQSRIQTIV